MICVPEINLLAKASVMPPSYLEHCQKVAKINTVSRDWCFTAPDYYEIRRKYRPTPPPTGFQRALEEEVMRGCCGQEAKAKPL